MAEAVAQDQSEQRVQDVGCAQKCLESADSAHHAEQNHVPHDHVPGLHAHTRPQSSVVQVPWASTEAGETDNQ